MEVDQPDTEEFQDAFPPPPIYYKLYGKDAEYVPPPPPKPLDGTFQCFGSMYNVCFDD
jgi:hypothetical protein